MKPSGFRKIYKSTLPWVAGICAAVLTMFCGVFPLVWIGTKSSGASGLGVFVASIAIGIRVGRFVAGAPPDKGPAINAYLESKDEHETALLRGITAGAFLFVISTVPLDLLLVPEASWLSALAYTLWFCVAGALAIAWGNFIFFRSMRKARQMTSS